MTNVFGQTTWGSRANADASDSGRMIPQKRIQSYHFSDEKLHEKLLPDDETMTYHYDQKHFQAPTA